MAHQGQCSGQVSLNLANLDFQGLTRFLSQGLLSLWDILDWINEVRHHRCGTSASQICKRGTHGDFCFNYYYYYFFLFFLFSVPGRIICATCLLWNFA